MEISNRKVTIDDLVDFGEVLLGEGLTSVNNYLSTVVNYHIDNENMESCQFFERRYADLFPSEDVDLFPCGKIVNAMCA